MTYYTKDALKEAIQQKLRLNYGCTEKQATDGEIMKACALALRDIMAVRSVDTQERTQEQPGKAGALYVPGVPDGPQPDEKRL